MRPILKAETAWIAVFESDFSSQIFEDKTYSEWARYWIKRSPDTCVHEAKSTGNRYQMRKYEVFDKKFNPAKLAWKNWTCLSINETYKDYFGCGMSLEIRDPKGVINTVYCDTSAGYNNIWEHLLFSCIMFYLFSLNKFKEWNEVISNKEYHNSRVIRIPTLVPITVYNRFCNRTLYWDPSTFKFDSAINI